MCTTGQFYCLYDDTPWQPCSRTSCSRYRSTCNRCKVKAAMQSRYHSDTEFTDTNHKTHSTLWVNTHTLRASERERERRLPISSRRRWLCESGVVTLRLFFGLQSLLSLDPSPCGNTAWQEEEPIALTRTCITHITHSKVLQNGWRNQHSTHDSTLNFRPTLDWPYCV